MYGHLHLVSRFFSIHLPALEAKQPCESPVSVAKDSAVSTVSKAASGIPGAGVESELGSASLGLNHLDWVKRGIQMIQEYGRPKKVIL